MHTLKTGPQLRLRLTEARTLQGWSQQEVADRIGTTHVNISRWERGITKPTSYFRRKLCLLFNKSEQELDLEPVPKSTGSLSSALASGEAIYDPSIPLQPAIHLVGRDGELAQIKQRLCTGGSVALTALNGLPGVGKTAMAIALAHDQEIGVYFRDGVLWAGLGPTPNIAGISNRWGALLGLSSPEMAALSSSDAWAKALRSAIGSRSMLLVIDDAWQVEDALTFKVGGPNCAHLVTTRFPNIATHIAIKGATLIQELDDEDSMTLLKKLAPGVVDREEKKAHDLVHTVGGLPLALTLIGNYLRKQAYSGQPRRISAALERLSNAGERLQLSEPHGPVESHPSLPTETPLSLQSVFAVTDQQLGKEARAALYALSVFPPKPNSFSEAAALAVAKCSLDTLDTLIDAGLLESSGPGRYTLHQTIADYAQMHLKDNSAYNRLIAYAINYVATHKKDYEELEQESNIILAALETAYELEKQAELVRAVNAFAPFLLLRGQYSLAQQHLQRAHQAATAQGDHYGLASTLLYLGEIAQKQGHFAQAEAHYQQGLTLARQINDPERISALLNNLGWVSFKRGEYVLAETHLQEGLTLARKTGHRERISSLLKMLGSLATTRGDYTKSEAYLHEGLIIARQIGDREDICSMLINLGVTVGEQGNYEQAKIYFQEGLVLARQIGHREWISALLTNLGEAVGAQGNYPQAELYFQEGLTLARPIGNREWICALLINLLITARKQRHYSQAEVYFQEGLSLARQLGRPDMTSNALYEYGNLCLDQRQIITAELIFREMLTTISEGDQDLFALAHYGLARVAAVQGNRDEALRLGEVSVKALEVIRHRNAQEVRYWLDSIRD